MNKQISPWILALVFIGLVSIMIFGALPVMAQGAAPSATPTGVPAQDETPTPVGTTIEILSPQSGQNYDWVDLKSGRRQIEIVFLNNGEAVSADAGISFVGLKLQFISQTGVALPAHGSTSIIINMQPVDQKMPSPGVYNGFIVITYADKDQTTVDIPITLTVPSSKTWEDVVVGWVQNLSEVWLKAKPGTYGWIVLGVLLVGLLYGLFRLARWLKGNAGMGSAGTVEIKLDNKSGEKFEADAEKALMEECLAEIGLFPSSRVPGGSLGENFITTLESGNPLPVSWLGPLIKLLWMLFGSKPGHVVNGTFVLRTEKDEPQKGLTIEIDDILSGKTENITTIWKEDYHQAAISAVYIIYYHVISGSGGALKRMPVWARFPDPGSFEKYQQGLALLKENIHENNANVEKAKNDLTEVAEALPNNALVRFQVGTVYEDGHMFLEALKYYLEILTIWDFSKPHSPERWEKTHRDLLIDTYYRTACTLSFAADLYKEWENTSSNKKLQLEELLKQLGHLIGPSKETEHNGIGSKDDFLRLAERVWFYLEKKFISKKKLSDIFSRGRNNFLDIVDSARYCTELKLSNIPGAKPGKKEIDRNVETLASKKNLDWQIHYNLACYYALEKGPANEIEPENQKKAMDQLLCILRDESSQSLSEDWKDWIKVDPDLKGLQANPLFQAVFGIKEEQPVPAKKKMCCNKKVK